MTTTRCVYCFAPRPADPYSRFCNDCGNPVPPLPQARLPPPEPGQVSEQQTTILAGRVFNPYLLI